VKRIAPDVAGGHLRIAIVQSRFNGAIGEGLLGGAVRALREAGIADDHVTVVTVPGALEAPLALQRLAQTGDYDALVVLGAVIRGETYHFEIVSNESAAGRDERRPRIRHSDRQRHPDLRHRCASGGPHGPEGLRGHARGDRDGQSPAGNR
jgi:hypothetical protein